MKNMYLKLAVTACICILALTTSHLFNRTTELILSIGVPVLSGLIWVALYFYWDKK